MLASDDVEHARCETGGVSVACSNPIDRRVGARRDECLLVDVDADDGARAELAGGDREDAGTAAVVEHACVRADMLVEPREAQLGRRMRAGAEGDARIEPNDDGGRGPELRATTARSTAAR